MNVDPQLDFLRILLGEPSDAAQARFTAAQLLILLNSGRKRVCEETECFQVADSQTTVVGTKLYTASNDLIGLYKIEHAGIDLAPVRSENWRAVIGDDDTIRGAPVVFKYHARQFQLFRVPVAAGLLKYEGWAYAPALAAAGVDTDLTEAAQEASCYAASILAKSADGRNFDADDLEYGRRRTELKRQYKRKGARYVADASIQNGGRIVL